MLKPILAAGAAAAALAVVHPCLANGRFPAANQLVFAPNDPNSILLRTTYALIPSTDNGKTWNFLCEGVLGLPADQGEDPSVGITGNGSLIVGTPGAQSGGLGLSVSTDQGCNWSCAGGQLLNESIADLAVRPDTPSGAVLVMSEITVPDGSTTVSYVNRVFETTDNGQTWNPLPGAIDSTIAISTIDVTKTDPDCIYLSGTRGYGSQAAALLLTSRDHGTTWTESQLTQFNPNLEQALYIGAIDPTNADRVYLRSAGATTGGQSRIYYTTDAGMTFQTSPSLPDQGGFDTPEGGVYDITGELLGLALSTDGSKIYIGTVESGLWEASTSDMVFTQKNPNVQVKCLAIRNSELWACSQVGANGGFVLGQSLDDGATFNTKIQYVTSLCGPIACAPNDGGTLGCGATGNASSCEAPWQLFCENTDVTNSCGTCGGSPDGGTPDGGTSHGSSSSGCGSCSTAPGDVPTDAIAGVALFAITAVRRRATRRKSRWTGV